MPRSGALRASAHACLETNGPSAAEALAALVFGLARIERVLAEQLLGTLLGADPAFERAGDGQWRLSRARAPAQAAGALRHLADIPFVVVDVETTGGRPPQDRITELAAVRVRGGRVEAEWSSLINPGRPIPSFVMGLTGISDALVASAPRFHAVAEEFLEFLGGAPFVAHNAPFDWRFVCAELTETRGGALASARVCTLRLARRLLPDMRRRNLDALAHCFGIPVEGRHRALGDARATARIFARLLVLADEQGIATEEDLALLAGCGGTLYPRWPY
ncbi:MAG: PolC-type DNA polymerase III [Gemmatimonadota bacterium]